MVDNGIKSTGNDEQAAGEWPVVDHACITLTSDG